MVYKSSSASEHEVTISSLGNLKGQYHAIFSNTLKIERRYSVDSSQDIMTKIPFKYYQNAKKLSTDVFAGR